MKESNLRSKLRRIVYSPLYERDINLAGALGIEPKLTESKSVVLPLHNAPTIKQDTFFTKAV